MCIYDICCTFAHQSLSEQEQSLRDQVVEQRKAVKAAAPNEKELKELEKNVAALKKGGHLSVAILYKQSSN